VSTGFDMTESIVPRSDQLNAEDLLTGPRTFTIAEVRKGSVEQPVDVHLVEFPGRPFKPSKTVRRIMVAAWGPDASTYAGRRMTLYRDPAVRFGGMDVGGIRVSHMSGIDKPMTLVLAVSKGKRAPYVVKPLADEPRAKVKPGPSLEALIENAQEARSNDELSQVARQAAATLTGADLEAVKAVVVARRAELAEPVAPVEDPPAEPTLDGWPEVAKPGGAA
jgi:hypothetical protein